MRQAHGPESKILTGIGPIPVRRPNLRDRGGMWQDRIRFSLRVLPQFA